VTEGERMDWRKGDALAYQNLQKRGYVADDWAPGGKEEYHKMEKQVRDNLVGRLYPAELLARVMKLAQDAGGGEVDMAVK
jgi:hypothetical protein